MARYCGSVCRLCRREGEKLFLKGERCYTSKCSLERREGGPGQHGRGRQSFSDYKVQLREKQKTRRYYGLLEKQFQSYFAAAARRKGVTGTELLLSLERRLDNVVYRLGFGSSRRQARQFVSHGLVRVNGKKVNIPSYQLSAGDVIEIKEKSKGNVVIQGSVAAAQSRIIPDWLSLDKGNLKGVVQTLPTREQLPQSIREQLIVELYSK
ncbi:MAG: 30S ribosomal protein S4 [SAR324 cluster bacterium]|uniref:Small ribosomal subunit protein uS4 n=1 Tax=SAR324 cluster bacterium TaxID=2024889 RepID=A0A7X9FQ51_9DELT|nr:30S ribosomal protein S4 [SAR324 cluster bacterium]